MNCKYESLDDHLRKNTSAGVTCRELNSHLFKASVLPTFTYNIEMGGGDWESLIERFSKKGMKISMMSLVKVCSSTTYYMLAKFGEFSMELYALKLTMGFQQRFAHLPSSWLVSQATSFSWHLAGHGCDTQHTLTVVVRWEVIVGSIWVGNPCQPSHRKTLWMMSRGFSC